MSTNLDLARREWQTADELQPCSPLGSSPVSWQDIRAGPSTLLTPQRHSRPPSLLREFIDFNEKARNLVVQLGDPGSHFLHDGPPALRIARLGEERERFLG